MKIEFDFRFLGIRLDVNQRKAYFLIGIFIFMAVVVKSLIHHFISPEKYHFSKEEQNLLQQLSAPQVENTNQFNNKIYQKSYKSQYRTEYKPSKQWSPFDPNNITKEELQKLPLPEYVINNIIKYKATGATFKNLEHFGKIYGVAPYIEELKPYLLFNKKEQEEAEPALHFKKDTILYEKNLSIDSIQAMQALSEETIKPKKVDNIVVEINEANIYQLMQIKGVGEWYANKLISTRDKLGGFITKSQIYELSGIPADRLDQFIESLTIDHTKIKKWKINKALESEIYKYPYFTSKQAKILILYRMHHKGIKSLDQLRDVKVFTEEEIKRLEPYLDFAM
jgi:DNA uptake protein ComE-like DNA-binding protein